MATNWRPEGWFNEYENAAIEPEMSAIKAACLELGADRMLEALSVKKFAHNGVVCRGCGYIIRKEVYLETSQKAYHLKCKDKINKEGKQIATN